MTLKPTKANPVESVSAILGLPDTCCLTEQTRPRWGERTA
jgi:hypothetical protein